MKTIIHYVPSMKIEYGTAKDTNRCADDGDVLHSEGFHQEFTAGPESKGRKIDAAIVRTGKQPYRIFSWVG